MEKLIKDIASVEFGILSALFFFIAYRIYSLRVCNKGKNENPIACRVAFMCFMAGLVTVINVLNLSFIIIAEPVISATLLLIGLIPLFKAVV